QDFRDLAAGTTRGCIVLERPDLLAGLMAKHGAKDSTARQQAMAELHAMQPRQSQDNPTRQIPEKSWAYRFAKRYWFNDFGAYANPRSPEEILGEFMPGSGAAAASSEHGCCGGHNGHGSADGSHGAELPVIQ